MKPKKQLPIRRNFIFNTCINSDSVQNTVKQQPCQRIISKAIITKNQLRANNLPNKFNNDNKLNAVRITSNSKDKNFSKNVPLNIPNMAHPVSINSLAQSNPSRLSHRSGSKIKIFSNSRGKSVSNSSHNSGLSKQKKGISLTKSLLQKISGISIQQSGRNSHFRQNTHNLSTHSLGKDSHNKTGPIGTTWDSQRTHEQYQLVNEYDTVNRTSLEHFGFSSSNTLNNSYETINRTLMNNQHYYQSFGYQPTFQFSRDSIPMNSRNSTSFEDKNKLSNNLNERKQRKIFQHPPNHIHQYSHHIEKPSFHLKIASKSSNNSLFSSKTLATPPRLPSNSLKKSKIFSKKQAQFGPLFQTAHQILSQQVSQYTPPSIYKYDTKGQELTNMLYGNPNSQAETQKKALIFSKNKTLDELSVRQSFCPDYDHYYR